MANFSPRTSCSCSAVSGGIGSVKVGDEAAPLYLPRVERRILDDQAIVSLRNCFKKRASASKTQEKPGPRPIFETVLNRREWCRGDRASSAFTRPSNLVRSPHEYHFPGSHRLGLRRDNPPETPTRRFAVGALLPGRRARSKGESGHTFVRDQGAARRLRRPVPLRRTESGWALHSPL